MTALRALIADNSLPGLEIDAGTALRECLDETDRVCSMPFWLEDMGCPTPTDAQMLSWQTVGDVERWMAAVTGRELT